MKVVLLDNLIVCGSRHLAGEEIELTDEKALKLLADGLAVAGVDELIKEADALDVALPQEQEAEKPKVRVTTRRKKATQ